MQRLKRLIDAVLKAWHIWAAKKRIALAARELEYGKKLVEWAEVQAVQARQELAHLEMPPTVYDCRLRRVN